MPISGTGFLGFVSVSFFAVIFVVYVMHIYNSLIELSRNADKAWANTDVLLKQRYDEIPKLLKVCQEYMKYEKEIFEKITALRVACIQAKTVGESARKEGELAGALKSLFAVAENYPDLKTSQNFIQLQQRISYLESQIADRRELYNESTNIYNIRINQVPHMWLAGLLQLKVKDFFKVSEGEKKDTEIKF